ncbi:hypothetical protein [Mangrovimonas aestuarii]|uniref:hypothetical protein n=1 Tax=Mangrovimonas aestuarii TaxID=3018443 RepID=UPI0023794082|nr:hypothetical protein [Mangrovimonas aestuarii]
MKSNHLKLALTIISVTILSFSSCSSDDDNNSSDSDLVNQIEDNVESGTWRITKFIDSGDDETNHFNGYNFTFHNSGVLSASNGTTNYEGIWSVTNSSSNDDNPLDVNFNIFFDLTNDFEELNDDWHFISESPTKIELIDISGGNGGTDYLTFEKN